MIGRRDRYRELGAFCVVCPAIRVALYLAGAADRSWTSTTVRLPAGVSFDEL